MPRVVVILADGFEEVEAIAIIDVLRRAEIHTVIAGLHDNQVISARNVKVIPDTVIDTIKADDFDMIVLPGGQPGSDNLNADPRVKELIRSFSEKGKFMGATVPLPTFLRMRACLRESALPPIRHTRTSWAMYGTKKNLS